ncbi:NCS2 family permease [Leyella stercorea]|jgi:AGZA family xanthine/uracil permease-like MFS transporter|uniref:NCS2 family permease n=1 Tax=Leyella stercorea TaxID=363265 RepID=UPI00266CF6C8|nr:NCS2 family permease [Leyella stercorea]
MLSKLFGFDPSKHNIKTEVMAGITTFLTMAYILAVNPSIFSNLADKGMDTNAVFTATALAAIIGTLAMAIYAKKPFGLAPGMGLNAFFVFTVCLTMGYSWQFALTAILIEGFIFVVLTLTKVRTLIVDAIPASVKRAIGAGIGLFIAFIGLKNAGIIVESSATFVTIGTMTEGTALLGVIGIVLTSVLVIKNVPGSLLIGILATALIGIPMGVTHFSGVVDTPPSVAPLFCQFEFHNIFTLDMLVVVFTFLFIDMFDTMGTLVGVCTKAGMMQKDGRIPGLNKAFMADAVATMAGACLGASTTTTYVESAAGVAQGGRSGLTAFSTAMCFVVAMFFAPLFLSIPAAATTPVLVIVGLFMLTPVKDIDLDDYAESIPAFITIVMMPLTYSISDGILCGVISYVLINMLCMNWKKLNPTLYVLAALFIMKYIFI